MATENAQQLRDYFAHLADLYRLFDEGETIPITDPRYQQAYAIIDKINALKMPSPILASPVYAQPIDCTGDYSDASDNCCDVCGSVEPCDCDENWREEDYGTCPICNEQQEGDERYLNPEGIPVCLYCRNQYLEDPDASLVTGYDNGPTFW